MMKIGFSTLAAPAWDLDTVLAKARELGFDGVELRGLGGELDLRLATDVTADPAATRRRFADAGVALLGLGTSATFSSKSARDVAANQAVVVEHIELAGRLGCPFVRVFPGDIPPKSNRDDTASRIARAIGELADVAARHRVTLLIENNGDFSGSADSWFFCDTISHPAVRACWNQFNARALGERPTTSIPRLGRKIGMVHVCDGQFDDGGFLTAYKPPGEGNCEVARGVELLRGIAYDGYLVFEWPKPWAPELPDPGVVLPKAAQFLKAQISATQPVLSAYKGDKNAPRYPEKPAPVMP